MKKYSKESYIDSLNPASRFFTISPDGHLHDKTAIQFGEGNAPE